MAQPKPLKIAILGGGISGLGVAVGLTRNPNPNLEVSLYEMQPEISETGAGLAMGASALHAIELLNPNLLKNLQARGMRIEGKGAANFMNIRYAGAGELDGQVIAEVSGAGQAACHRGHLVAEMAALIPDGVIKLSHHVKSLTHDADGVTIEFDNGVTDRADFAIGCDGIHGKSRKAVLGAENPDAQPSFFDAYVYRSLVPMPLGEETFGAEVAHMSNLFCGPNGWITMYPVDDGRSISLGAVKLTTKGWNHPKWTAMPAEGQLDEDFAGPEWGEVVHKMIPLLREKLIWGIFEFPHSDAFFNDRICLVGDSAHASSPTQGSGAAMAIEDALVLSWLLKECNDANEVRAAFKGYDAVRRPRTLKQIATARQARNVATFNEPGIGSDAEKIRTQWIHRWDWIWEMDFKEHIQQAEDVFKETKAELVK